MKKVLGISMLVIGILFAPLLLVMILTIVVGSFNQPNKDVAFMFGYILGGVMVFGLLIWLDYLLIKHGIRLKNNYNLKKQTEANLDALGKN